MKKILIVEDDQLVASAYKKRFGEAGYLVEWAPDGLEGIKMVGASKPDVVLLDLLMPRLDGIEVLKYIRTHPELKNLPVVVFSNSYMTNLVESAWRNGADQCLMKASTTPAQLFDAVNKAMQKAAARMSAATAGPVAPVGPITPLARPDASAFAPPLPLPNSPNPSTAAPKPATAAAIPPVSPLNPRPPASAGFSTTTTTRQAAASPAPAMPDVDPEFQAQIRQLFLSSAPAKLSSVREAATAFVQDLGSSMQLPLLGDLFRKVHSLTGNAAVAGCSAIAHFASTFEAFLQELQQKPKFINPSTTRAVERAVQTLETLFRSAESGDGAIAKHQAVLVITGDVMSSQTIGMALEKADLSATIANDATHAISLAAAGSFAGVVMTVNLPGLSGFELCAQLQSQESFGRTPVLFISDLKDFGAHSNPEVIGENDIMGSPYLLIELTLRALTLAEWSRAQRYSAAA